MDFWTLKDKFICDNPDYANDVTNFINYIRFVHDLKMPEKQLFLVNAMRTDLVINSLKHYVDTEQIRKQEPARKYFVAIKQLFEYVLANSDYTNEDFSKELANPSSRENSYNRKTNAFIHENESLLPKEPVPALVNTEIHDLIKWCDYELEKDYRQSSESNAMRFKRITAHLCIKLIILTGITYRNIRKLRTENLNVDVNTISINGFVIRLPKNLSMQFREYQRLREAQPSSKPFYLFSSFDGKQLGESTASSSIPYYLKLALKETSGTGITSIAKYGITQLLKNDTNDTVIMKLTGANREILDDCLSDHAKEEWGEPYINSKIVNTEMYYEL